jgi:hypothetical protein
MRFSVLIFLLLVFPLRALAALEPFIFFSDEERGTVNGPLTITPEYYSDYRTFQQPFYLHDRFLKSENAFDLGVGSLSGKRFLNQKRLKLNKDITDRLNFKLFFVEREDFEEERRNFLFGLGYALTDWLELNAYGSLFFEKNRNDIGFSFDFDLTEDHELKLFVNLPDYQFTERNLDEAEDLKSLLSYGIYGVYHYNEKSFFEYYAHNQSRLERLFRDQDLLYSFEELRVGGRLRQQLKRDWFLNVNLDWIDSEEGNSSPGGTLSTLESWSRDSLRVNLQSETISWVIGLEANYRYWVNQNNQPVLHRNFLPYFWKKIRFKSFDKYYLTSIDLGLDAVNHWSRGDLSLRDEFDQEDQTLESRLNVRLSFDFSKNTNLILILTGDIDDPSWEGGGGQFQMLF